MSSWKIAANFAKSLGRSGHRVAELSGVSRPLRIPTLGGSVLRSRMSSRLLNWGFLLLLTIRSAVGQTQPERETTRNSFPNLAPLLTNSVADPRIDSEAWMKERVALKQRWTNYLGAFPKRRFPLHPRVLSEEQLPQFTRQLVSYEIEKGVPTEAYLLTPNRRRGRLPAIVVFHQTVKTHAQQVAGVDTSNPELMQGVQLRANPRMIQEWVGVLSQWVGEYRTGFKGEGRGNGGMAKGVDRSSERPEKSRRRPRPA